MVSQKLKDDFSRATPDSLQNYCAAIAGQLRDYFEGLHNMLDSEEVHTLYAEENSRHVHNLKEDLDELYEALSALKHKVTIIA
jgi:hypothetical protein